MQLAVRASQQQRQQEGATTETSSRGAAQPQQQQEARSSSSSRQLPSVPNWEQLLFTTAGMYLLTDVLPASADALGAPAYAGSQGSYVVSLGLFLFTLPGEQPSFS